MSNTNGDELNADQPRHKDIDESKRACPERGLEQGLLAKERTQKYKGEDGELVD